MLFDIYYPVNSTDIDLEYMWNSRIFHIIDQHLQKSARIDSIIIHSYSSPEGPFNKNKALAIERGRKAREFIKERIPSDRNISDSIITVRVMYENWDGLKEAVFEKYPFDDKDHILALLDRQDISSEQKKTLLKTINSGIPWEYIKEEILPGLRFARCEAVWVRVPDENALPEISHIDIPEFAQQSVHDTTLVISQPVAVPMEICRPMAMVKTNLLYDLASFTNLSVEVPIYKDRISALCYYQFPWWRAGQESNEYCNRFVSLGFEGRWWWGDRSINKEFDPAFLNRFTGHFIGIYAESGIWDFQYKRKICHQGEFWSAGLSYGYSTPIGKRLNLEFSISAGYASIPYRGYTPSEDYEYLFREPDKVGTFHYFGPTKAQISLVVPITAKIKKGGRR